MKKSTLFPKKPTDSGGKSVVPKEELEKLLKQSFGHSRFRGKQLEAIQAVLSGRDCFCLMPTGGGKSMCYQIPALAKPGIVLVVSPLIALMESQVAALKGRGIRAEYLSSAQTANVKEKIHEDLDSGKPSVKLLYVTPELIATLGFKSKLTKIHSRGLLSLIAIDEAHCVSTWGHDFRPSYRKLSSLRSELPDVPLLALTATAAPNVQDDVIESLGLQSPLVLKESFNRPNIFYEVRYKDLLDDVYLDITKLIKSTGPACSIIYCLERSACNDLSAYLMKNGISCAAYHAGLNNKARSAVLDDWISSKILVVVATVAFGMGIDRKDVRIVCHYNIPKSMEAFYQESGRAGRDQLPSRSLLYYGLDDRRRMEFILRNAGSSKKSQSSSSSDGLLRKTLADFSEMVDFCERSGCRRQKILESFGEQVPTSLCQKGCDACKYPEKVAAFLVQLSNVQNVFQKNGLSPALVKSSFNMVENGGTEFWNREDESNSLDEDISDSDDVDEVVENLAMPKLSSKSRLNKIDLLQRAEETYYQKRDTNKQAGGFSGKKVVPETLRVASKQRLLNALKQAQERIGNSIPDVITSSTILETECYRKYGKVGKTFYNSQVASTIRWLSSSTFKDICDRLCSSSTQSNCSLDSPVVSSSSQNSANKDVTPTSDGNEGTHGCVPQETSFPYLQEKLPVQRNEPSQKNELHLPPIPSFTDFVKQKGKVDRLKEFERSSKESSRSSIDVRKRLMHKDDAQKRIKLR